MGANWSLQSRLAIEVMVTSLQRDHWRRACWLLALMLALTAIFLVWIALGTDWDLLLADRYFDVTAKAFPPGVRMVVAPIGLVISGALTGARIGTIRTRI